MVVYVKVETIERTRAIIDEEVHCRDLSCVERL